MNNTHKFWCKIQLDHSLGRASKVAIVILGGGLTREGQINPHVELRVQRAFDLYTELKSSDPDLEVVIIPISGGTTHKPPPLDSAGFPITEAQVGRGDLLLIFSLLKMVYCQGWESYF